MSTVWNNNIVRDMFNRSQNVLDQINLKTAKGQDDTQIQIWADFDLSLIDHALFSVPRSRDNSILTLHTGITVIEKQKIFGLLTLQERIVFRRRIVCIYIGTPLFIYPKWDLEGPDIPYFGEWNKDPQEYTSCIVGGPWTLDGRKMVADAKDRALQMVEAAIAKFPDQKLVLKLKSGIPMEYITHRGWNFGKGPWYAFWSGIRKAQECVQVQFVAWDDEDPYEDYRKFSACTIPWQKDFPDHLAIDIIPQDPFAILGSTQMEKQAFKERNIQDILPYLGNAKKQSSEFHKQFRHPLWNPDQKLKNFKH